MQIYYVCIKAYAILVVRLLKINTLPVRLIIFGTILALHINKIVEIYIQMARLPLILIFLSVLLPAGKAGAQTGTNDTIRLGAIIENGVTYPVVLLPEFEKTGAILDPEEKKRRDKLRTDIYIVYPYAIAAAAVFGDIHKNLETMDRRRDRKQYLKAMDKNLEASFKQPLKSLTIDQGHVLIKLINRQTGQNCYSIIKELKGGFNAMIWQGVGVMFNNNLIREYDPQDRDREVEHYVKELEASLYYRYQLAQQEALLKKVKPTASAAKP